MTTWLVRLWWLIRGVGVGDYRALCHRCGRTGQVHFDLRGCWRFARERRARPRLEARHGQRG